MARKEKKPAHHVQMTDGKRAIIQQLIQEYDIESAQDIQDALKDLLGGTSNLAKADMVSIWKHGRNSIDVQSGDLFRFGFDNRHKKKNIVVIPVNTAFDTHVTRKLEGETYPLVSENTIHGQWLVRLKETGENLNRIDERIADSLKRAGFCPIKKSKTRNGIMGN